MIRTSGIGVSAIILMWIAAAALGAEAGPGLPDTVIPDCLGVCIHRTSWSEGQLRRISAVGFRIVRTGMWWRSIERSRGVYDFTAHDRFLSDLSRCGIGPIMSLSAGNELYDGIAPASEEARRAFASYAGAAAAHYKGQGIIWKIWNEPNLKKFWPPAPSAENYAKLALATAAAIRAADPEAIIIAPNICGKAFDFLETSFKLGLLNWLDAVSVHPYGCKKPEDAIDYYAQIRTLIGKYAPPGKKLPIVCEEWGFPSIGNISEHEQARLLARMMLVNAMCDIGLTAWYDWKDDGTDATDREKHFGVVQHDFAPKPAYSAIRTLALELRGFRYQKRVSSASSDYVLLFRKGGVHKIAAWTADKPHSISLPLRQTGIEIVSMGGTRKTAKPSSGLLHLGLTGDVQYIGPIADVRGLDATSADG